VNATPARTNTAEERAADATNLAMDLIRADMAYPDCLAAAMKKCKK
jgi:hypothetical protein